MVGREDEPKINRRGGRRLAPSVYYTLPICKSVSHIAGGHDEASIKKAKFTPVSIQFSPLHLQDQNYLVPNPQTNMKTVRCDCYLKYLHSLLLLFWLTVKCNLQNNVKRSLKISEWKRKLIISTLLKV